jgi:hemolysin III
MMSEPRLLHLSHNTERALSAPRPRLRGVSHLVAALFGVPLGGWWIVAAAPGHVRWGIAAFVVGMSVMFSASAALHLRRWTAHTYEALFRLDHTGIYFAIGGTGLALALLGLDGWPRVVLFLVVTIGVTIGIVVEWLPFALPRGFSNSVYISLGWVPIVLLPWLWIQAGPVTVVLLLIGGVLYTAGAVMVAMQRPRLFPSWFGYHEVWHLFVIVAVGTHAAMLWRLANP